MDVSKVLGRAVPFADLLGIQFVEKGEGRAVLTLEVRPQVENSWKAAHGGAVMTLLDIAMASAARTRDPEALGVVTVEMKTSFIGAARGTLRAEGRCVHLGKSVAFCEGSAHDREGNLVARASGTFMLRHAGRRKAAAGEPGP